MKRLEIDISDEAHAQMTAMCAAVGTTPEAFFTQELRGIWGRLQTRYTQFLAQQQATDATVRIVNVDPPQE